MKKKSSKKVVKKIVRKKVLNKGGRPPKYETVEQLQVLIEEYFRSCWIQKIDMFGNPIYFKDKNRKKTNKKVMIQFKPYTITGLAVALDTSRKVLIEYQNKDKFSNTIKRAKEMCQQYAEESLFIGKNPTGAIFNLKNNYEWKDKNETDLTTDGKKIEGLVIVKDASPTQ